MTEFTLVCVRICVSKMQHNVLNKLSLSKIFLRAHAPPDPLSNSVPPPPLGTANPGYATGCFVNNITAAFDLSKTSDCCNLLFVQELCPTRAALVVHSS